MNPPRCFISYSWDSDPHQAWVRKLATRLRENGVDAILDQFHCKPGTDLTKFMEKSVRESSFVLLVCTQNFSKKANAGAGGVGYEKAIVTGEIFAGEAEETKFIPLLREGDAKESLPSYLKSRLFLDFREDAIFESRLEELLRHFYSEPLYPPPPVGQKPKFRTTSPPVEIEEAELARKEQVERNAETSQIEPRKPIEAEAPKVEVKIAKPEPSEPKPDITEPPGKSSGTKIGVLIALAVVIVASVIFFIFYFKSGPPSTSRINEDIKTKKVDTRGYTAASIQVREAVGTTGEVVKAELASAIKAGATTANNESAKNLNAAWAATMSSLDGMVAFAQSIEQIVDAGNKGAESARQVGDSVKRLVGTVKVDATTEASAKLLQLSTDTVAFVYGEYAKHIAAKSLEEALDKFGPSMVKISTLVEKQIADAYMLFAQQIEAQVQQLDARGSGYADWIKKKAELNEKQKTVTSQLLALSPSPSSSDSAKVNDVKTTLAELEMAHQQIATYLNEYNEKLKTIRQREKAGQSIFSAAENAVAVWGVTYQQLAKAVKERKPVSVDSLVAAVAEIKTLSQRWREL